MPVVLLPLIAIILFLSSVTIAGAQQTGPSQLDVKLGYLRAYEPQLALSVLDVAPRDEGVAGADVAIADNNTTGKFLGQAAGADGLRRELGCKEVRSARSVSGVDRWLSFAMR